jgi:histone H4
MDTQEAPAGSAITASYGYDLPSIQIESTIESIQGRAPQFDDIPEPVSMTKDSSIKGSIKGSVSIKDASEDSSKDGSEEDGSEDEAAESKEAKPKEPKPVVNPVPLANPISSGSGSSGSGFGKGGLGKGGLGKGGLGGLGYKISNGRRVPLGMGGIGKAGPLRHRKVLKDPLQGITKPSLRRLARRGGVKRISGLIYEEARGVLKVFLEDILRDAVTYTQHAGRKTVTVLDVVYSLKRQGKTLYGFGPVTTT